MRVASFVRQRDPYPFGDLEAGISAAGDSLSQPNDADAAVTWNAYGTPKQVGKRLRDQGRPWVVMENGYLKREAGHYAMGLGGWAGMQDRYPWEESIGPERFETLGIEVKPWKAVGGHVLVLGQMGGGYSDLAMDSSWPERVLWALCGYTDRTVVYRPHPRRKVSPLSMPTGTVIDDSTPLPELLEAAHTAVVWTSNAATDAILAGVPVVQMGPSCAVKELCGMELEQIEDPFRPDREPVLWKLAWHQFSREEIRSGWAWKLVTGREIPA